MTAICQWRWTFHHDLRGQAWRCGAYTIEARGEESFAVLHVGRRRRSIGTTRTLAAAQRMAEQDATGRF